MELGISIKQKLLIEKLIDREKKKRAMIRAIADGDCILEKCKVIGKRESEEKKRDRFESFDGPCCCCRVAFLFEPRHCKLCRFNYRRDINAPIYECS